MLNESVCSVKDTLTALLKAFLWRTDTRNPACRPEDAKNWTLLQNEEQFHSAGVPVAALMN